MGIVHVETTGDSPMPFLYSIVPLIDYLILRMTFVRVFCFCFFFVAFYIKK